jgi:hypothetical protein
MGNLFGIEFKSEEVIGNQTKTSIMGHQEARLYAYMVRSHKDTMEDKTMNLMLHRISSGNSQQSIFAVINHLEDIELDLIITATTSDDVQAVMESPEGKVAFGKFIKEDTMMGGLGDLLKRVAGNIDKDKLSPERKKMLGNMLNGDYDSMDVRQLPLSTIEDHLAGCKECMRDEDICDERKKLLIQQEMLVNEKVN